MEGHKLRLLFLNPPASRSVFRDCYCSGITKGGLSIHPLDLQLQSGYFTEKEFSSAFLDGVVEKLNISRTIESIERSKPDAILSLVGGAFLQEDTEFFNRLKTVFPEVGLYLSGDIARFSPKVLFQRIPRLDGLLMDFASPGLLKHLRGEATNEVLLGPDDEYRTGRTDHFEHPLPSKRFILRYRYQLPFFRKPTYYSMATSFGCPFGCDYCNTHMLGYRIRPIDDIVEELYHAYALGFRSLYIRDATSFYDRGRTIRLLKAWEKSGLDFQWICFTRPDLIDEELARRASRMGCRLMMLGVESFDEECMQDVSRSIRLNDIVRAFHILRRVGIHTAAQIIVGLSTEECGDPVASGEYEKRLKHFLNIIDPDYVSMNVFYPRPGSKVENPILNRLALNTEMHQTVANRINRYFYARRPKSAVRQVSYIRSPQQLAYMLRSAVNLLRGLRNTGGLQH
jgi:radical SAM superfamily enzyme YgiQ (UPF0313 family)